MDLNKLRDIGLTENQASVYLELLKNPKSTAGFLAKRLSIDRSFIYEILSNLKDKGFVSYSFSGRKRVFYASDPKKLLEDIEEKKSKMLDIVKEIKLIQSNKEQLPLIQVHEGKAGLRVYVRSILESKEFHVLGGGGGLNIMKLLEYELPHYFKKMKLKKIKGKVICSKENKDVWIKNFNSSYIKLKSLEGAGRDNSISIMGGRVIISSETEKPSLIVIDNEHIAHTFRYYFEQLWGLAEE